MATVTYSAHDALSLHQGKGDEVIRLVCLPIDPILMPTFQRDRIAQHIAKMAADWDETAYVFPVVALFKGSMYAIDGQQRIAAAQDRGMEKLDCLLVEGVRTFERLSELFLKINRDRKLLNAFQKYFAAVAAKDRGSLNVRQILCDFELEGAKSASANGKVPIGAIVQIYSQQPDLLKRVLHVRTQAWGVNPSKEANEGKTLLGLALFVRRHWDKLDDDRIIAVLRRHHPGYLLQATDQSRGNFKAAYSDYLRNLYNKGLRGKGRL